MNEIMPILAAITSAGLIGVVGWIIRINSRVAVLERDIEELEGFKKTITSLVTSLQRVELILEFQFGKEVKKENQTS